MTEWREEIARIQEALHVQWHNGEGGAYRELDDTDVIEVSAVFTDSEGRRFENGDAFSVGEIRAILALLAQPASGEAEQEYRFALDRVLRVSTSTPANYNSEGRLSRCAEIAREALSHRPTAEPVEGEK